MAGYTHRTFLIKSYQSLLTERFLVTTRAPVFTRTVSTLTRGTTTIFVFHKI